MTKDMRRIRESIDTIQILVKKNLLAVSPHYPLQRNVNSSVVPQRRYMSLSPPPRPSVISLTSSPTEETVTSYKRHV